MNGVNKHTPLSSVCQHIPLRVLLSPLTNLSLIASKNCHMERVYQNQLASLIRNQQESKIEITVPLSRANSNKDSPESRRAAQGIFLAPLLTWSLCSSQDTGCLQSNSSRYKKKILELLFILSLSHFFKSIFIYALYFICCIITMVQIYNLKISKYTYISKAYSNNFTDGARSNRPETYASISQV